MTFGDIVAGAIALCAVFASGYWCGQLTARRPSRQGNLGDLWGYYRALNNAARELGRQEPGDAVRPALLRQIDEARAAAVKQARWLPSESQWVLDPKAVPGADGQVGQVDDVTFIVTCMAEEIRTKLERREAGQRAPRAVPGRRVGESQRP